MATVGATPVSLVDVARVGEFLRDVARCARPGEGFEAGAAVAIAPGRRFDVLLLELGLDLLHVNAARGKLLSQE